MPRVILVIKPSSLGDIVHTLPAVSALRARWPHAVILWIAQPEWAPLLRDNPAVDRVHIFPRAEFKGAAGVARAIPWMLGLRKLRPDLALDFQGLIRSALMARFSGAAQCIGPSDAREGARLFYDRIATVSGECHAVDRSLRLALEAGGAPPAGPLEFPLPAGRVPAGFPFATGEYLVLHPSARGPGKSLTAAQVAAFTRALHGTAPVAVVGGSAPRPGAPEHGLDLRGRTSIEELVWVLRNARFTVSVDSGPMHLAAAMGDRVLGIHSWTDPRRVGPYAPGAHVWKSGVIRRVSDLDAPEPGSAPVRARGERARPPTDVEFDLIITWVREALAGS